ncbi:MAG: purine-binding chemotaxis protein CheW [Nitrospirae bacterium]|nr:purine-binding chemotaxis protein CheW [Candidatus Troglogloeales bacterium]MBI3598934.1 purine-binding chemotaxis protein CheW [Candidatus Troglogloeales bacterium]
MGQTAAAENALEQWEGAGQGGLVKGDDAVKALTFWLANEEYAIDISVIEEITRPIVVTTVPRVSPYIKGIVNLRGRVIPVLNMHVRMGLAAFVPGNKNRFIICRTEQSEVGIIADRVTDVVCFEKYQLEPPPAKITASGSGFIKNIGRVRERILIVLDTDKILRIAEGETAS